MADGPCASILINAGGLSVLRRAAEEDASCAVAAERALLALELLRGATHDELYE